MPVSEEVEGCFPLAGTRACTESTAHAKLATCSHLIHGWEVVHMCTKNSK